MTKLDMLWVRACKSKNPQKRLRSVYRRFYLCGEAAEEDLAGILCDLVDKYLDLPLHVIVDGLNPEYSHYHSDTYYGLAILFFRSKLRLSKATVYKGYIAPRRFR